MNLTANVNFHAPVNVSDPKQFGDELSKAWRRRAAPGFQIDDAEVDRVLQARQP